jgi:acetyltransferase-like isoleucine patch superfamily enzyme
VFGNVYCLFCLFVVLEMMPATLLSSNNILDGVGVETILGFDVPVLANGVFARFMFKLDDVDLISRIQHFVELNFPNILGAESLELQDQVLNSVLNHVDNTIAKQTSEWMALHAYNLPLQQNRGEWTGNDGTLVVGTGTYNFIGELGPKYFVSHAKACGARLVIGKYCSLGTNIEVILCNHITSSATTYPLTASNSVGRGDVVVGHDVWIGSFATLLPGARVGDGAVIGAQSVVAGTIPPYAVAVGNPARVVKYRFDNATIAALLEAKWWDWPRRRIHAMTPLLTSSDVVPLILNLTKDI